MAGPANRAEGTGAPFGTEPRRGNAPIYFWGALYALWFGVLIWLVFFYRPV
jgi:hypothetical protein